MITVICVLLPIFAIHKIKCDYLKTEKFNRNELRQMIILRIRAEKRQKKKITEHREVSVEKCCDDSREKRHTEMHMNIEQLTRELRRKKKCHTQNIKNNLCTTHLR